MELKNNLIKKLEEEHFLMHQKGGLEGYCSSGYIDSDYLYNLIGKCLDAGIDIDQILSILIGGFYSPHYCGQSLNFRLGVIEEHKEDCAKLGLINLPIKKKGRSAVSKRLRFEILSKCNFKCIYCGRNSNEVKMHIDHKKAASKSGTNDVDNLVAACEDCNLGKGNLDLKPDSLLGQ